MMNRLRLAKLIVLGSVFLASPEDSRALGTPPAPRIFQADPQELSRVKAELASGNRVWEDRVRRLKKKADKLVGEPLLTVIDKPRPSPDGDKHDYVSLARYYWPDPSRPGGTPYLRHDGKSNPEIEKFDEPRLAKMSDRVATLALAYYFSNHEPYAESAAKQIQAWFLDPTTRMNPNMKFAQFIPGRNEGRGAGILDSREFMDVIDAIGMIQDSKSWGLREQSDVEDWFRAFLKWLRDDEAGKAEASAPNNHGSWYDAQVCDYALFVGDVALAKRRLQEVKLSRIARQIRPTGEQPEELKRTNSFDYSVFNLEALFALATMGKPLGVDLWDYRTPDGRSLRKAVDYLIPFASGEARWPFEQIHEPKKLQCGMLLRRASTIYANSAYQKVGNLLLSTSKKLERGEFLYPDWSESAGGDTANSR